MDLLSCPYKCGVTPFYTAHGLGTHLNLVHLGGSVVPDQDVPRREPPDRMHPLSPILSVVSDGTQLGLDLAS